MTRILLFGEDVAAVNIALLTVILASAALTGPPWTWPRQVREAWTARRHIPTPRHSLRAGRRDVVDVCAELDASWR